MYFSEYINSLLEAGEEKPDRHTFTVYFITDMEMDKNDTITLKPRVPKKRFEGGTKEDDKTPRICCALSPYGCIRGLGLDYYYDEPNSDTVWRLCTANVDIHDIIRPTRDQLPDWDYNDELWITVETTFKLVGEYKVTKVINVGESYARLAFTKVGKKECFDPYGGPPIYSDENSINYIGFDSNVWDKKYKASKEKK